MRILCFGSVHSCVAAADRSSRHSSRSARALNDSSHRDGTAMANLSALRPDTQRSRSARKAEPGHDRKIDQDGGDDTRGVGAKHHGRGYVGDEYVDQHGDDIAEGQVGPEALPAFWRLKKVTRKAAAVKRARANRNSAGFGCAGISRARRAPPGWKEDGFFGIV